MLPASKEDRHSLVDFQDGQGPRLIEGVRYSIPSRRWLAHMTDPQGNYVYVGDFATAGDAKAAIESLTETFRRMGNMPSGTVVGGPRPRSGA